MDLTRLVDHVRPTATLVAWLQEANDRFDNPAVMRLATILLRRHRLSLEDRFLALSRRARARLDTGDYVGSDSDGVAASELQPDDADTWHNLGIARERLYLDSEAAECFERALELSPVAEDYVWLTACRYYTGEGDKALVAVDRAVALDPTNAQAWRWRASLQSKLDLTQAVEDASRAIQLDSENSRETRRSRATWLVRLERYAEAIAEYDALLEDEPADDSLHVARAYTKQRARDLEGAIDGYASAYALAPHDLYSGLRRISLMHRLGRTEQALKLAREEALHRADSFEAWHILARAERLAGNLAEALAAIDRAIALMPGRLALRQCYERILILAVAGRAAEARALREDAKEKARRT